AAKHPRARSTRHGSAGRRRDDEASARGRADGVFRNSADGVDARFVASRPSLAAHHPRHRRALPDLDGRTRIDGRALAERHPPHARARRAARARRNRCRRAPANPDRSGAAVDARRNRRRRHRPPAPHPRHLLARLAADFHVRSDRVACSDLRDHATLRRIPELACVGHRAGGSAPIRMILIVDDDPSITASLALLLKQHGYRTEVAGTADEALARIRGERPRLVVQDMNFTRRTTGEEGLQLLSQIRDAEPSLPVILMTAWGSIALAVEGMKRGAADFITKPWSNAHVVQSIETALGLADA